MSNEEQANLKQKKFIIDSIFMAYMNHDGYGWHLCDDGVYRVYSNNDPHAQKHHIFGCRTFTQLIDWLIEQAVKG